MIFSAKRKPGLRMIIIHSCRKLAVLIFLILLLQTGFLTGNEATAESTPVPFENTDNGMDEKRKDFLLGEPRGFLGLRVGMFFPQADSDVFDMITRELTLGKSDFRAWEFGADFGIGIRERLDLVFHFNYSKSSEDSEFRDFVDEQGFPITQHTSLRKGSITTGIKYSITSPGRQISAYAWVPSRFVPFVEIGVGALNYELEQTGSFVDSETFEIFGANLKSSDWAEVFYLGGGTDIYLLRNTYLTLDLRYSWASGDLGNDFIGFDDIDLGGLHVNAGLCWLF